MVFDTQDKKKLIDKFKLHETDTGSPEVQVGLLTYRISSLTEHLKIHEKRSSFPQGSFDACWQTPQTAELCEAQRRQSLSRHNRYPGLETLANPKGAPMPPE